MLGPESGPLLRGLHESAPSDITDILAGLAGRMGAYDMTAFLVDFEQSTLFPVPDRGAHVDSSLGVSTEGTLEGRSFVERRLVSRVTQGSNRVCVPILEGSDCTGVLTFTMAGDLDEDTCRRSEELGMLAGAAIAIAARYTDQFNLVRRRKAMSLPASIQWDARAGLRRGRGLLRSFRERFRGGCGHHGRHGPWSGIQYHLFVGRRELPA
jgi:hypothetical protein